MKEEVSAIVRCIHSDRSLPQIFQNILEGFGDRSLYTRRSIAPTDCIEQSRGFRRSFAVYTAIDRFHRLFLRPNHEFFFLNKKKTKEVAEKKDLPHSVALVPLIS
jgi:hypothetical protein